MPYNFFDIVKYAGEKEASDIHLSSGSLPAIRVDGQIEFIGEESLLREEVEETIKICLSAKKYNEYGVTGDMDGSINIDGCGRYRINVFRQKDGSTIALRPIRMLVPELKDLNLPDSINRICELKEGLVLVTGPTGCGKSTTIASIVNEFNKNRKAHIITIEEPIEYIHNRGTCMINQREIGHDSISYATALKAALREDPDIIVVGEMRDLESISMVLTAAETGHLVLSTLHTLGAAKTIDRLVDVFRPEQQQQIKIQLSMALKSVISQRLIPKADGSGRIAAFEMMFVNSAISNQIREGKTININQTIQTGIYEGMMLLEKHLYDMYVDKIITEESAMEFCIDTERMKKYITNELQEGKLNVNI